MVFSSTLVYADSKDEVKVTDYPKAQTETSWQVPYVPGAMYREFGEAITDSGSWNNAVNSVAHKFSKFYVKFHDGGELLYGNAYRFPCPIQVNYLDENGKYLGRTQSKIQYYKEGAFTWFDIDYSKVDPEGIIEIVYYVEGINSNPTERSSTLSCQDGIDGSNGQYKKSSNDLRIVDTSELPKVLVYEDPNLKSLKTIIDYEIVEEKRQDPWTYEWVNQKIISEDFKFVTGNPRIGWYHDRKDVKPFSDVPSGHWAEIAIDEDRVRGYVSGVGNNKYNPSGTLTKAQVAQIFYNVIAKDKDKDKEMPEYQEFPKDVNKDQWFAQAAAWGVKNSYIDLDSNGNFNPNAPATRGFTVRSLYRVVKGEGIGLPYWKVISRSKNFPDLIGRDQELIEAIRAMQKSRIISGYPDGTFGPDDKLTRAQIAVILDNFLWGKYNVEIDYCGSQFDCEDIDLDSVPER